MRWTGRRQLREMQDGVMALLASGRSSGWQCLTSMITCKTSCPKQLGSLVLQPPRPRELNIRRRRSGLSLCHPSHLGQVPRSSGTRPKPSLPQHLECAQPRHVAANVQHPDGRERTAAWWFRDVFQRV
jgi:hypothetical protein